MAIIDPDSLVPVNKLTEQVKDQNTKLDSLVTDPASESTLSKLTVQLKDQNTKLDSLVGQGEASAEIAEKAAAAAREAAREAARRGEDKPEIAVKVELEEDDDSNFMGATIAAVSGALLGSLAGLATGFVTMWADILKFFKGKFIKAFPDFTKSLGEIFGKEGKIAKVIKSIKAFFTESKAFKVMDDLITKGKKAIDTVMKPVKATFTSMKTGFTSFITKIKSWIKTITGPIDEIKKLLGLGGKAGTGVGSFGKTFGKFFSAFKGFFSKIFVPLQVIISLVEGFFEAKDAVSKSEGMMATFFNAIVGFFGGILDGLIFGMLDLIKDGISWIAGFLGFKDVEKFLDSFSFSKMFNEFLDDIYKWFNLLFKDPVKALTNLLKGFFGAHLAIGDFIVDMLKKPLIWIMELFGWDDAAASTEKFSFSDTVMKVFDAAVAWIKGLFTDPIGALTKLVSGYFGAYLDIADWLVDMIKKPIVWLLGLFGWDDAAAATEKFSFKGTIMGVFDKAVAWIKKLFADPVGALTSLVSGYFGGALDIASWLVDMIKKPIVWLLGVFGWDDAAGAVEDFSLKGFVYGIFDKVKAWFTGIFSWASEEDESDSWIVKKIKGIVTGIKEWFGSMFNFDSASGVLKTVMNIMLWVPNLLVKAMAGITSWVAGLLGFDAESEAIAAAGKEFSFADLIIDAVKAIGKWFGDMFDSITNFDFASMARGLMPDFLADMIFGDEVPKGKKTGEIEKANKAKTELDKEGTGDLAGGGMGDMFSLGNLMKPIRDKVTTLLDPESAPWGLGKFTGFLQEKLLAMLPTAEGLAEGGLVGMSKMGPQSMGAAMGLESGGLFTLSQGEFVLDNQAAQSFLQAAMILKGQDLSSGQSLMNLERDKQATAGSGSAIIVNNNNSQQINSSQPMVLPASEVSPASPEARMSS